MLQRTARLNFTGGHGTIEIDGTDISRAVHSLTLESTADELPRLRLDLILLDVSTTAEARVLVPEEMASALVALGWTPPGEQPPAGWLEEALRSRAHREAVAAEVRRLARVDRAWARTLGI